MATERWTLLEIADHVGSQAKYPEKAASRLLSRLGIEPVDYRRAPGRRARAVYDADEIRAALAARPGAGHRSDIQATDEEATPKRWSDAGREYALPPRALDHYDIHIDLPSNIAFTPARWELQPDEEKESAARTASAAWRARARWLGMQHLQAEALSNAYLEALDMQEDEPNAHFVTLVHQALHAETEDSDHRYLTRGLEDTNEWIIRNTEEARIAGITLGRLASTLHAEARHAWAEAERWDSLLAPEGARTS